jgi:hypothetical protein
MITIQIVTSNVQTVLRQSPDICWHAELFSKTVFSIARSAFRMCSVMAIFRSSIVWGNCSNTLSFSSGSQRHLITLYLCIIIVIIEPLGRFGRNQSPVRRPVWLWHAAFLGKFLGVIYHCFPLPLDVPTSAARYLHVPINASSPSSERWNCGREWSGKFAEMTTFYAI